MRSALASIWRIRSRVTANDRPTSSSVGRGEQFGLAFAYVKALRADGCEQVVQVYRGMNVVGNQVIYLVVGEIAFFVESQAEFLLSHLLQRAKGGLSADKICNRRQESNPKVRSPAAVGLLIRFLFIGSRLCSTLLSDPASRRRPCASLSLHLHQVVKRTSTSQLSNMLGTRKSPCGTAYPRGINSCCA